MRASSSRLRSDWPLSPSARYEQEVGETQELQHAWPAAAGYRWRHVASGGTSDVWRIEAPGGPSMALKVLHSTIAHDESIVVRFRQETRWLSTVSASFFPKVLREGRFHGRPAIALTWVEGDLLSDLLARAPIAQERLGLLGQGLLGALQALHAAGLVHRDVKCDNVILPARPKGTPAVLLDLGAATVISDPKATRQFGEQRSWAPERYRGDLGLKPTSDLYAAALVLYRATAQADPFATEPTGTPPPLRVFRPGLPPTLDDFFAKAMAMEPNERFQGAAKMARAWALALDSARLET